ncbi:deoxynucleotide monophosphate kinase [Agrobacterium rosae]|uniref:Deoxynucleotide monophosphate kinase n=1 Tax=Agrobacterium rosae TaxID=1972867 RepID=A0AAE5VRX0_9HYPH|nr:deoxynucleotide monophosphate kinase [Agrobacterium rosae]
MEDFRANFTLGETITSKDTGCLAAVPANDNVPVELCALGAAIGKGSTAMLPPVIALTGLAGSGKSTASKYLVEKHGYQLVKFAGPLKDMLRAIGLSEAQIEGELKEEPCEWLQGATPRHAMQTLGTQWGRACIGPSFWIGLWVRRVNLIIAAGGRVVVDDCRFPNEADDVRKLGGVVWKIVGRGGIAGSHVSEAGCGEADMVIQNTGSVDHLCRAIFDALSRNLRLAA